MIIAVLSLLLTGQSAYALWQSPGLSPFIDRTADGISAEIARQTAKAATPEILTERITAQLDAPEHNWLAIDALLSLAGERGITLPEDLTRRIETARNADHDWLANSRACLICAADPAECRLSAVLLCQAPMVLTPLGDVAGLAHEGVTYASGGRVDRLNLALSAIGIGATGLVLATGGSSYALKLGASLFRTARKMRLVTPELGRIAARAADEGVDWGRFPAATLRGEPSAALRPAAIAPLVEIGSDLGRIADRLGPAEALHLMRYVDNGTDARRLARASDALGEKTVGRVELLGKQRFLRATVRFSDLALRLTAGLVALLISLGSLAAHLCGTLVLRGLRRRA